MRKTLNTLRIILSLENTINVNGILYGFTRIPIIGKYIPEQIYGIRLFKIYAFIIALLYEALKIFFGEIFLFPVIFLFSVVIGSYNRATQPTAYLYAFLMASLFLTVFFDVFKSTLEAEYAVLRLGLDAKEYVKAILFRKFLSMILGHTFLGIPSAILAGVEWYIAILIPFAGLGFIATSIGIHMSLYAWKRSLGSRFNKKATKFSVEGGILLTMFFAFALAIAGTIGAPLVITYNAYLPNVIVTVLAAAVLFPALFLIRKFPYGLYRTAFSDAYDKNVIQKQVNEEYNKGTVKKEVKINNAKSAKSGSSGYKYLNEIFIKRHTKILFSRLAWELIAVLIILAGMSVLLYFERMKLPDFNESVVRFFFARHPGFYVFAMYSINIGAYIAYAMYTNCDSTFLKFAFYRKKEALHQMYRLRALSAVKINLIPAVIIAVFGVVSIMLTGGEDYFSQCIFTVILCLVSSVLFSVRHMTVFYIFQPYTDKFKGIKSVFYYTYSFIIGAFFFALIIPKIPVILLAFAMTAVTALYIFIADKIVGKYAQKTFVLK